jgi:Cu-Zn family superoxide dismutase
MTTTPEMPIMTSLCSMRRVARASSIFSILALGACGGSQQSSEPPTAPEAPAESTPNESAAGESSTAQASSEEAGKTVQVTFEAKSGSQLAGTATLTETGDGVRVLASLENVPPGEHGAHVHERGDCSAPDGASAGEHFNPTSHPHGLPHSGQRHLGDLGNVSIGGDGRGSIDVVASGANLEPNDPNSFLGKSIIVHEKRDDGGQPSGNAGGRIGCTVIE